MPERRLDGRASIGLALFVIVCLFSICFWILDFQIKNAKKIESATIQPAATASGVGVVITNRVVACPGLKRGVLSEGSGWHA